MYTALKSKVVTLMSNPRRMTAVLGVFFIAFVGIFVFAMPAMAGALEKMVGWLVAVLVGVIGKAILLIFDIVIGWLAPYNNFVNSAAVNTGWVLTRDIANMFFILILLAIAFGTILKIEQLNYQKLLPKLLIMAVLINFSKTICGLIIDFAQVIMLTFVNAFIAAAGGNFLNALGIAQLMQLSETTALEYSDFEITSAYIFGLVMMVIALIVVIVYAAVLAYRIVMLWILIITAPIAFLAGGFPIGKASRVYGDWWDNFVGAIVVGPILAFFLWLTLLTAGGGTLGASFENTSYTRPSGEEAITEELGAAGGNNFFITQGGTTQATVGFIIAAAMLLGGMAVAQQAGGQAGAFAGSMAAKTKGYVGGSLKGMARGAGQLTAGAAKKGAVAADRNLRLRERVYSGMGKIPGLKTVGLTNLAKVRGERASRTAEMSKTVGSLAPNELNRLLSGPAVTAEQKDLKMVARKESLGTGYAKYLKENRNMDPQQIQQYQKNALKNLETEAQSRGDVETMKWAKEYREKRPHFADSLEDKRKIVADASPEDMKKWSADTWKDSEMLQALAEKDKIDGSVSSALSKIGGVPQATFKKYESDYGEKENYPGAGTYTTDKGFQSVSAAARAEQARAAEQEQFRQQAKTTQIETLVRERNDAVVSAGPSGGMIGADENRRWTPSSDQAMSMKKIQEVGGNAEQSYNYNIKEGKFNADGAIDATAAKNTFGAELRDAASNLKQDGIDPEIKTEAANFVTNLDIGAVDAKGQYQDAVVSSMDDQVLKKALSAASDDQKAQVEKLIGSVSGAIKEKLKEMTPGSEDYNKMFEKYQKMKLNQSINKHVS